MPPGRCHVVPHDRAPQRPRPSGKTSSAVRQPVTGGRRVRVHYSVMQKVTAPDSSAARALATRDAAAPDAATRETATHAGDLVPADARLVDARDLHVQQAAMTGEALPVEKTAAGSGWTAPTARPAPGDEAHLVMLGTSVVSGTGVAIVTATGSATAYGDIARRLVSRRPETEFERGMRDFSALITRVVVVLIFFLLLVSILMHRSALESLLFAVALAVGLVPEFLPMITSVTLANGAVRMAREQVIVKHLQAIQNLGSIDVLCSDKTGTLTSGQMQVVSVLPAGAGPRDDVLRLAYLNSRFETGIRSPLDAAILQTAAPDLNDITKLDEIPFDFERRLLSIVIAHADTRILIAKGAPESILERCTTYDDGDGVRTLDDAA